MIKKIHFYIILLFASSLSAQEGVYNYGDIITINSKTNLYVNGNITTNDGIIVPGLSGSFFNRGNIYVTDTIKNTTSDNMFFSDSMGTVLLNGSVEQVLEGGNLNFFSLVATNSVGVKLNTDITVQDSLIMNSVGVSGLVRGINLNGNTIYLPDSVGHGVLIGESNWYRVYGDSGKITTTRFVGDIGGENVAGLGFILNNTSNIGMSTLERYHTTQTNAGDGSVNQYFVLSTTNPDSIAITFHNFGSALNGLDSSDLSIYYSKDSVLWRRQETDPSVYNVALDRSEVSGSVVPEDNNGIITVSQTNCINPPIVNFPDTLYRCGNDTLMLDLQNPGMEYLWSTNDTIQVLPVSSQGVIWGEVIDNNGCIGRDTVEIIDAPYPVANFSTITNSLCLNEAFTFSNSSVITSGSMFYHWDFGDSTLLNDTSNVASPSYSYLSEGLYNVQLIATSDLGCIHDTSMNVRIHPLPQVLFSMNDACADSSINFINMSSVTTPVDGQNYAIASYAWDMGDGTFPSTADVTHQYSASGTYTIELVVMTNAGCTDSLSQTVTIYPNPTASFTNSSSCTNTIMGFVNTSSNANNYTWNFGDGTTSNLSIALHAYPNAGNYNVTLTASTTFGCTDVYSQTVTVDQAPIANYSFTNSCANTDVLFTNTSSNVVGAPSYEWSFGDGNTDVIESPINNYSADGTYSVTLLVNSSNGCSDSTSQNIAIYPVPNANFTVANVCEGSSMTFSNTSTLSSGTQLYNWSFGDGGTSSVTNPSHLYASADTMLVTLIATSDFNCADTLQQEVVIYPNPIVNLGGNVSTCGGSLVLDAENIGASYIWSDASTNQTLMATVDGSYWVSVTDANSCISSDTANVLLNVISQPNLGVDTTVCDSILLDAFAPGASYSWSNSSLESEIYPTASGTYWVERIDQNGCVGSDTINLIVNYSPIVELGSDTSLCIGEVFTLDAFNTGNTIQWSTGETTQSIVVDTSGTYLVDIITPEGCYTSDSINVVFNPIPVVNLGNDTSVCDSLILNPGLFESYTWDTGQSVEQIVATVTGIYSVEVSNVYNCYNSDTISIEIFNSPIVDLGSDITSCNGAVTLSVADVANNYNWSSGETTQSILADTSGSYWVTVNNANCSNSDTINVMIDSVWGVNIGGDQFICPNAPVMLDAGISNVTYLWESINNGTLGVNQTQIVNDVDMVWVTVTNGVGCQHSDTTIVNEAPYPVISDFLVATNNHVGDTVHFVAVTTDSITDYYWNFGDGIISSDESPSHIYYLIDTFQVELVVANDYCSDTLVKPVVVSLEKSGEYFVYDGEKDTLSDIEFVWMYPNPNNGLFTLEADLREERDINVSIFDMSGNTIFKEKNETEMLKQSISLPYVESGVYLLIVQVGLERKVLKWVKI